MQRRVRLEKTSREGRRYSTRFGRSYWFALVALSVVFVGCDGGDSGGMIPATVEAGFAPSGTPSGPGVVRLVGKPTMDLVELHVVIGGPTSNADIYSFAFDLVLGDESIVEYVGGSARHGSALTPAEGQQAQVMVSQHRNRITVGVTKAGGGSGNEVASSEVSIVTLTLRILEPGATTLAIEGSPPNPPTALDSVGARIGGIRFDDLVANLTGR